MSDKKKPDFDSEIAHFTPRQMSAIRELDSGKVKFLLYGGALGGGKSYFLRWYAVRRLMVLWQVFGIKNAVGMLACEDYPSLKDRQIQKIMIEFPAWLGKMHDDHKAYGRCFILAPKWGGGVICFRNLDDPSKYASSEWAFILVDELTKNKFEIFDFLRTRLRVPGLPDIECQFVGGTNPGSIGHGWVKQFWMDKTFPDEWITPTDYRPQFAYVPSKADDNPHITAEYWAVLGTLPEQLRKAFRDGDWNIFVGQAFPQFNKERHVVKPIKIPEYAQLYMTFDWGFGAPFSIGWWWVDADGRLFRFMEWYGWNGQANQGLRLEDSAIINGKQDVNPPIRGIKEREKEAGISGRQIIRLAGPDCFSKKPDYKGGGKGRVPPKVFAQNGIYITPGDPSRALKIRQFRERLKTTDSSLPMLVVYDTCTQFIRTIPNIVMDDLNVEDIDTSGEDHIYDEACHICMARPLALDIGTRRMSETDKRIEELENKYNTESTMLERENDLAWRDLGAYAVDFNDEPEEGMVNTI